MTVTEVQYGGESGTAWVRISGTIAEVLQEIGDKSMNASRCVYYNDGGTNAVAVYCKQE